MATLENAFFCELRVIEAKNLEFISTGKLFVRCYLCTGNNERIRLNGREIPSTSHPYWNESVSLECSTANDQYFMDQLKQQSVMFELRWRNNSRILGRIGGGSKLLGRAVVSWKDVLESSELEIQKWITTASSSSHVPEGLKPPALHIGMKVRVPSMAVDMVKRRRDVALKRWNKCGCRHGSCCNCADDDLFAIAAAIEAL